jgi:hypothetical protein
MPNDPTRLCRPGCSHSERRTLETQDFLKKHFRVLEKIRVCAGRARSPPTQTFSMIDGSDGRGPDNFGPLRNVMRRVSLKVGKGDFAFAAGHRLKPSAAGSSDITANAAMSPTGTGRRGTTVELSLWYWDF